MTSAQPAARCHSCDSALPPGARFCPSCGARQTEHVALSREFAGEHRQITVMFCDVVGSTELASRLDSEDLRDVLRAYQTVCAEEIGRHHGMISHYLGDGVIAYFGYPRAREDSAIRGVDAALEIARRLAEAGDIPGAGAGLAARVALHTGRVLVGEMGSGETREHHALTGVVPNIAARLEQHAPRNGVVVSAQTRALVEGSFHLESLGRKALKGVPDPIEVFQIVGRASTGSVLPRRRTTLIGRETELATLLDVWRRAGDGGTARAVVIAEPGAGKSSLAAAFLARSGAGPSQIIELAGSEAGRHTPFAALAGTIDRRLRSEARTGDPLARIAEWFAADDPDRARHAETLFRLWSGDAGAIDDPRRSVLAAGEALVRRLPAPVLIAIEDAHWVDASSLDIMDRLRAAPDAGRMLLVLARQEFDFIWTGREETRLHLSGLGSEACREVIEANAGGRVEISAVRRIGDAANCLPLHVEELTKALIATGALAYRRGAWRVSEIANGIRTPDSLLGLMTARLDTLGEAKLLAQISAVLGPAFSRAALIDVSGLPHESVDASIAALSMAGILTVSRGGRLAFRHALYQTAAYESLVRDARRTWHMRYLAWLEAEPERLAETRPETLGRHLEGSGKLEEAAARFLEAGLSASGASASHEAAAHFLRCVTLRERLPAGPGRDAPMLQARVLLAGALLSSRGPGSPETRDAYEAALALADRTPETEWHFPAWWGWWRVSDSFATMAGRARRLLAASERMQGLEFRLQARHCVWANSFQRGELDASAASAREGLKLYEEGGFEGQGTLYGGHDCKVCALGELALTGWLQGAGDAAAKLADAAFAHAGRLEHLGSVMHALDIMVMLHHYRRDPAATARTARELLTLGAEHELEEYRAKGRVFLGWSRVDEGSVEAGLCDIDEGFGVLREIGTPEDFPVYQCMRAAALRRLGDIDGAVRVLAEGGAVIEAEGVNYWGAEIARSQALTEMARAEPDAALVIERLDEAGRIAASQGALALELCAAVDRLRFTRDVAARDGLAAVLGRFPAAARGRDIAEARALLEGAAEHAE